MLQAMESAPLLQRATIPSFNGALGSLPTTNPLQPAPPSTSLPTTSAFVQQLQGATQPELANGRTHNGYNLVILTDAQLQQLLEYQSHKPAQQPAPLQPQQQSPKATEPRATSSMCVKQDGAANYASMAQLLAAVDMVQDQDRNSKGNKRPCTSSEDAAVSASKRVRLTDDVHVCAPQPTHERLVSPAGSASSSPQRVSFEHGTVQAATSVQEAVQQQPWNASTSNAVLGQSQFWTAQPHMVMQPSTSKRAVSPTTATTTTTTTTTTTAPHEVLMARTSASDDESACSIQTGSHRTLLPSPTLAQARSTIPDTSVRPIMCSMPANTTAGGHQVLMQLLPQDLPSLHTGLQVQPAGFAHASHPMLTLADVMRSMQQQAAINHLAGMQCSSGGQLPMSINLPLSSMPMPSSQHSLSIHPPALSPKHQPMPQPTQQPRARGCVQQPNVVFSVPQPTNNRDIEAALKEVLEVMLHKPKGRPVKYIDLGVNRMALKYHVGVKLNGRVESMGATDTELAAHMLLDMVRIGLGLYTEAAAAAKPANETHPEEQSTSTLQYHPSQYSTCFVQRVVAQLINRNLVATSELLHAYTRAHMAGCRPGPCYMSVSQALAM